MRPLQTSRFFLVLVATVFLAAACSGATLQETLQGEGFTKVDVIRKSGANRIFVTARINGHDFTLLVDTGATTTALSREAAVRNGIAEGKTVGSFHGINGVDDEKSTLAVIQSFSLAGVSLNPSPVVITNFQGLKENEDIKYDGLLGLTTMRRNHVVFSYLPALFFFNPRQAASRQMASILHSVKFAELAPPLFHGGYLLPLFINGHKADVILDSGAPYTLIDTNFAYAHSLKERPLNDSPYAIGIEGKDARIRVFKVKTLSISTFTIPAQEIAATRSDLFINRKNTEFESVVGLLGFDTVGKMYGLLDTGNDRLFLRRESFHTD